MALLDHPIIGERYFFPRSEPPAEPFEVVVPGGERLRCHRHPARGGRPTLVFFHGNGSVVADWESLLPRALAPHGLGCFLAEYRGFGGSGGVPQLKRMLDDVPALLAATGVPPERLFVYGRSVGSIYALEAVHREPGLAGLIIESGIADVFQRLAMRLEPCELGTTDAALRAAVAERFDHREKLEGYPGPVLILHAEDDALVGLEHAQQNHAWCPQSTLHTFAHGGHNGIISVNWDAYLEVLLRFLNGPVHPSTESKPFTSSRR